MAPKKKSPTNANPAAAGETARPSPKRTRRMTQRAAEAARAAAAQRDEQADQQQRDEDQTEDEQHIQKPQKKKKKLARSAGVAIPPQIAIMIRKAIRGTVVPMFSNLKSEVADMLAGAERPPPAVESGPAVSPILAATAASAPATALEYHLKIYKIIKMLASQASDSLAGDPVKAQFSLAALSAFANIAVQAAENLGPQQGCGLNAMVRYISSMAMGCLEDPYTAVYNKSAAEAMLATARAEVTNRSPGGKRGKGNRSGAGNKSEEPANRDDKSRDGRRDAGRDTGRDRYQRR